MTRQSAILRCRTPGRELRTGWPMILACAMGVGTGLTGLPYYTFGTFLKPLAEDFGWTRSQVSLGSLFLQLGIVVASPFLGRYIDRHGARGVALCSLAGLALGFGALALSGPSLTSFYGAWILVALLGSGTSPLAWTRMINRQFDLARGLALGLVLMGTGIASMFGPRLCALMIASWGWRGAYAGIGAFILIVALPVVWLGTRPPPRSPAVVEAAMDSGLTLAEAAGRRQFWMMAVGILLVILVQAGAMVHLVPMLTDGGMSPAAATGAAGLMGLAVIIGRLCVGALVDRFHAPYVAAVFLPTLAVALLLFTLVGSGPLAIVAILLMGLAAGAEVDLLAYLASRYFGMRHYGSIYGAMLSFFSLGGGLGPFLAGWSFDATGGYTMALRVGAVMVLGGAALIVGLGRYPTAGELSRPIR